MNMKKQLIIATASLFFAAGAAVTSADEIPAFEKEMQSCLAAVNDHADYDQATRVRHDVVELKNTYVGYVLEIDTQVYTASAATAARAYSSYCVARGTEAPRTFRIHEVTG